MIARFLAIVGVLTVLVVFAFGWSFFGTDGPMAAESNGMGAFILVVFGIPAVAFCALLLFGAAVSSVIGTARRRPERAPADIYDPDPQPRPPSEMATRQPAVMPTLVSILLFIGAVLWSIPFGFLTFVGVITSDLETTLSMGGRWLLVALPLLLISAGLRRI